MNTIPSTGGHFSRSSSAREVMMVRKASRRCASRQFCSAPVEKLIITGVRPLITAATTLRMPPAEVGIITPIMPGSNAANLRERMSERSSAAR